MDNLIIELINKEVDGVASAEESARLKSVLRIDPEARRLFDETRALAAAMTGVRQADPPPTLKHAIIRALESRTSRHTSRGEMLLSLLRSLPSLFSRPGFVFLSGLAAGILLFFIISNMFGPYSVDDTQLTGTMVLNGIAPGFSKGEFIQIDEHTIKGSVETQYTTGLCLLRLRLDARETYFASFVVDPGSVHIDAVRPLDGAGEHVSLRDGELSIEGATSGGLAALLSVKGEGVQYVHLRISSHGTANFDSTLVLGKTR